MSKKGIKDLSHLTCPYEGETLDEAMDVSDIEGVITDDSVKDFQNHVIPEWYANGMRKTIEVFDSTPNTIKDDDTREKMLRGIVDKTFDRFRNKKGYEAQGENGGYILNAHVSHRIFMINGKLHFPEEYYINDANTPIIYARDIYEEKNGRHFLIGKIPLCHMTCGYFGEIIVDIPGDIYDKETLNKYGITRQVFIEIRGPLSDKNIIAIYNGIIKPIIYPILNIDFETLINNHPDLKWQFRKSHHDPSKKFDYCRSDTNISDGNGVISMTGQMGSLNK